MFERDSRVSRMQFPLWWMNIGAQDDPHKRRLIVEPYAIRGGSLSSPELRVWVENDTPQWNYTVKSIADKPKGPPEFRIEPVAVEASRRFVSAKTGLEIIVIEALSMDRLTGDCAERALSQLFWTYFVLDDDGLTWLNKYASKEVGNFYASQRLVEYVRAYAHDKVEQQDAYTARHAVEEAMKDDRELGERMCRHVYTDAAFQHAIEALLLTNESEEIQHANIRRIVELRATDEDHVFAGIVAASRGHAFRGLRACQRAERDPEFLAAVAAIARATARVPSARAKCINAFLHKSRKP